MTCVAIIPARGGSRRIPRKNIRLFHGKPIIAYPIQAAKKSGLFGEIIVSTDDEEIAKVALSYGATSVHVRSPAMAEDEVGTQEVMKHVLEDFDIDRGLACCIYPCAPMLSAVTLRNAGRVLYQSATNYVVPVATWLRDPGQFYFGQISAFREMTDLRMATLLPIDPATECDINTECDWLRAENMYLKWKGQG